MTMIAFTGHHDHDELSTRRQGPSGSPFSGFCCEECELHPDRLLWTARNRDPRGSATPHLDCLGIKQQSRVGGEVLLAVSKVFLGIASPPLIQTRRVAGVDSQLRGRPSERPESRCWRGL